MLRGVLNHRWSENHPLTLSTAFSLIFGLRLGFSQVSWDLQGALRCPSHLLPQVYLWHGIIAPLGPSESSQRCCNNSLFRQTYTHSVTHMPVFASELSANTNLMRINSQFLTTVSSAINYVSTSGTTPRLPAHHIIVGRGADSLSYGEQRAQGLMFSRLGTQSPSTV